MIWLFHGAIFKDDILWQIYKSLAYYLIICECIVMFCKWLVHNKHIT